MPAEGLDWLPGSRLLSDAELLRLITIAVTRLGVRELRFTGGEPLLRRGLEDIVGACAQLAPRPDISLTTNGIGFDRRAAAWPGQSWTGSTSLSTRSGPTASR
jgi:cyclic pyranopterin phosphate synthase